MKTASFTAVSLGIALLVLGALWTTLFSGTAAWTDDKADRWTEIKARLHNLAPRINTPTGSVSMHSGDDYGQLKQEYDKLKIEHDEIQVQFESAAVRPHKIAKFCKWSGISLAVLGIVGWYASNQSR